MNIKQNLLSQDKYNLKCPYTMTPKGICIHNTANSAPAKNEASYARNNNSSTGFHIAIDDIEAIQIIPFNRNAFHSGDGRNGDGNRNYIAIEICYSTGDINKFLQAEKNTAKVVAQLLKQYGWGIERVKKHQDFSGKYCPHKTLDLGWGRFINLIKQELANGNSSSNNSDNSEVIYRVRKEWNDAKSQIGAFKNYNNAVNSCIKGYKVFNEKGNILYSNEEKQEPPKENSKEYVEHGTAKVTASRLNIRDNPEGNIVGSYSRGQTFIYDYVKILNNRVWVRYLAYSGNYRWVCVKENGTRYANCY